MGLLICAYDVSIGDKITAMPNNDYVVEKYSGGWYFIDCIEWITINESSDPDSRTYLRPLDIDVAIQSVRNNDVIPTANKLVFMKLLGDMKIKENLYIYLNI